MKIISTLISASVLVGSVSAILGGQTVPQGSKTYTTGLRSTVDPKSADDFSFCGGVLISPTHVLTTASCTTTASANFVSVGAHYINGGDDGDEIKVKHVKDHPHFNATTLANDFSVPTLVKPSKYKPVKLPAPGGADTRSGMWATAMGWGLTAAPPKGMGAEELQALSQQVISNDADTGGPFIKENGKGDGDDILIGLVSGGSCGVKNSPAIYSRVSSALPFINDAMKVKY
ncbi:Glucanase inhibitor protein [Phytophthora cinnamomi]|uniref:Glucanase inhibitor protein n=1 Tax=Phytophthora cinnamomi TaxID=4785 RepID=UPI00355A70F5|nr:Glucanase inhibitor protein [Phytophthora cinnamomi]